MYLGDEHKKRLLNTSGRIQAMVLTWNRGVTESPGKGGRSAPYSESFCSVARAYCPA